jgi:hypothetical protein
MLRPEPLLSPEPLLRPEIPESQPDQPATNPSEKA